MHLQCNIIDFLISFIEIDEIALNGYVKNGIFDAQNVDILMEDEGVIALNLTGDFQTIPKINISFAFSNFLIEKYIKSNIKKLYLTMFM